MLAGEWLQRIGLAKDVTICDPSCGNGAFFNLEKFFPHNKYVGYDIDAEAIAQCQMYFPQVDASVRNSLLNVSRTSFGFKESEKLCIVGNPPYNDTTSIIGRSLKGARMLMDKDLEARDLGLSSLLSYNKLKADYVLILTPLSYLVKKANFYAAKGFFSNYRIVDSLVFSSQEFAGTSRLRSFPILIALYERHPFQGLSYSDVWNYKFTTQEGDSFSLSDREYVSDCIEKYPHNKRYDPKILFYTLRDINALMRSRTFIHERCANAVDVNPVNLPYYCYLDVFKRYAKIPYWMGNFNVPFLASDFQEVASDVVALSKSFHPEIFGETQTPSKFSVSRVQAYINTATSYKKERVCYA